MKLDLSNDVFLKLYNALVRPLMEYGNISFMGPMPFVGQKRLERI